MRLGLGLHLMAVNRGSSSGMSPVTFTDDLSDGVGTPVAITTSLGNPQPWQRGTSTLSLSGTYDLSGDPTGMAWRVGSGDWYQLTSETIGSGNWTGTLTIPASYLAQGQLQVKPVNGANNANDGFVGNTSGGGFSLGIDGGSAQPCDVAVAEIVVCDAVRHRPDKYAFVLECNLGPMTCPNATAVC